MSKIQMISDKILEKFFNKQQKDRMESDIRHMSKYLSQNYDYFKNLKTTKDFNPQKIEKIIKYAKLELIQANKIIFNYGESGDKFYILLQGSVSLFKPEYKEMYLTPYEFYEYITQIKDVDLDILKYERILEKNSNILGKNIKNKDLSYLSKNKFYYNFSKKKFFIEKMEKVGEFKEGFAFGEMALIRRTTRNATIVTNVKSLFLTIGKKDYNIAIRELHDKILSKDIEKFVKDFPIFEKFSRESILEILNNLSRKTIYKGDYLYKKGEESDNIYFLKYGNINLSFNLSFAWFDDYLKYFNDNSGNMIIYLMNKKPKTFSQIASEIKDKTNELNDKFNMKLDSNNFLNYRKWEECTEKINKDNFMGIKNEEDKLNKENKIFFINLKNIKENEIIGLEDSIECKRRFFNAKCISEHADFLVIKTLNLVRICRSLKEHQLFNFLGFIIKRKDILTFQIMNKVKFLEKDIIFSLNNKYDLLKGDENDIKNESDKDRIISLIKFKGFKTQINELLDKDINASDYIKSSTACKSFNSHLVNPTSQEAIDKNKEDLILLKKIDKENSDKQHILKIKRNINNITNFKLRAFNKNKNRGYKISKIPFSPSTTTYKYKILSREKTFDNYNHDLKLMNSTTRNDFSFNSVFSPDRKSNDKKLFTKLFPNLINTQRKVSKDISNKILSVNSSPLINSSYNTTEIPENKKNKITKNENKGNYFNKIYKNNKIYLDSPKSSGIINTENNSKNKFSIEQKYYDKLRKKDKEFYFGEKFNKKFLNEYNKIKPIRYQSFRMKSK